MTADSISILARIAQSVGATEPALRLLISILVGKFNLFFDYLHSVHAVAIVSMPKHTIACIRYAKFIQSLHFFFVPFFAFKLYLNFKSTIHYLTSVQVAIWPSSIESIANKY